MKDWLLEKVRAMFGPKYIGSTVRALLQAFAGVLISWGLPESDVTKFTEASYPLLVGIATWVAAWVWSLMQKKKHSD